MCPGEPPSSLLSDESIPAKLRTDLSHLDSEELPTALNGEHSEMKIESVPMEFLTDSVRLIYVWRVVCGHSLPFDVFFGTMIGVELFPGRDVFSSLHTQFIWDRNLALHVTPHSLQLTLFEI